MAERQDDLSQARPVDFSHVFSDASAAQAFANTANEHGFLTSVEQTEGEDYSWDVTATKVMVPTCEDITAAEALLANSAEESGGRSDGWGCWAVASKAS